jgi:cytochrome b
VQIIRDRHHPVQSPLLARVSAGEEGFQTAEAIGISAVGLLVLFAIWGALSVLGVDLIEWIRASFGIGSGNPVSPPA